MARALFLQAFVVVALTSCAAISGLAEKEAVDCPGDCEAGIPPPRADGSSGGAVDAGDVQVGPPKCDPAIDAQCLPLPVGWTLVARAELAAGLPPACPIGMASASTVKEAPVAQGDACTCESCTTGPATCSGQVAYSFSTATTPTCLNPGDPNHFKNPVAGTCYQDLPTTDWQGEQNRFVLPNPSGGSCSVNPVVRANRVTFGETSALCDDTSRCSGGFCDARIDAPFQICVARPGSDPCPEGFATKHVVGTEGAELDCGTCSCTLNRGACQGAVHLYRNNNCFAGYEILPANGTCGGPSIDNLKFGSYKVVATSNTTCNTGGTTAATNVRMKDPRTVCCRS